jgi:hypothetical protein
MSLHHCELMRLISSSNYSTSICPKLIVLTPHWYPHTPFVNSTNTSVDYVNTFVDCTNIYIDYISKFFNSAHTSNDYENTFVESTNIIYTPISSFRITNSSFCTSWSILLKNTDSLFLYLSFNDLFIIQSFEVNIVLT